MDDDEELAAASGMTSGLVDEAAFPLYVQSHQARVAKDGECLTVSLPGEETIVVRLAEISHVAVLGNATVTTPALHALLRRGIPICWHAADGWFLGHGVGLAAGPAVLRQAQVRTGDDPVRALGIARGLVAAKIRNSRARLRGAGWSPAVVKARLSLRRLAADADQCATPDRLRGLEGAAAAAYFGAFAHVLAPPRTEDAAALSFTARQRRPPPDPVNALLSFAYALLTREMTVAVVAAGLDPMIGFYHVAEYGRPSLALDLMEPYRPLLADAAVQAAINRGSVGRADFDAGPPDHGGVRLAPAARKALIAAFEERLSDTVTLPWLGFAASYRRLIALQPRLLSRFLAGERHDHPVPVPRQG